MHPTNTRIRRLAYAVGLALTALAALATGAGASGSKALECEARAQACMTAPEYRALMIRSGALNRTTVNDSGANPQAEKFVPGVTDFPSRLGERGERAADERLAQRSLQGLPVHVQTEESGFDWSAAATGALAATLLLLGASLAVRMAKRTRVAVG